MRVVERKFDAPYPTRYESAVVRAEGVFVLRRSILSIVELGLIVGFTSVCSAESIHGVVSFESVATHLGSYVEEVRVRPVIGRHLPSPAAPTKGFPIETSLMIRESLGSLQEGDFVVLSGQYLDQDQDGSIDSIYVNGIESVGLKRLIRAWKSDKWDIMKFENFNRMVLYRPNPTIGATPLRFQKLKEMNYTLAPEQGSGYTILMVEAPPATSLAAQPVRPTHSVFAGKLTVEEHILRIELFDTKSGLTAEVYSLSPL